MFILGIIFPKGLIPSKNLVSFYETHICPMGGCVICFFSADATSYSERIHAKVQNRYIWLRIYPLGVNSPDEVVPLGRSP